MIESVEEFLRKKDWKYFENFVSEIFETHGFKTKLHYRFKGKGKREVDVLAWNDLYVFLIECKKWGKHRYKTYQLKKTCEKLNEIKKEFIISTLFPIRKRKVFAIIITLFDESISFYKNVPIVPLSKLNYFILNVESILEDVDFYK